MHYDSGGMQGWLPDGPTNLWLLAQHHHGVRAAGNYGTAFKAGCGVTQGGLLSAKLFNTLVNAVVHAWVRQHEEDGDYEEGESVALTATFFAIFYVKDTYLASWNAGFLQHALTILVDLFQWVGLQTNTSKTQMMICTPGRIRTQLPTKLHCRMRRGMVTAARLCIPAGIPGIPRNPQEPGFKKKGTTFLFRRNL
jgi:hypothetical protein